MEGGTTRYERLQCISAQKHFQLVSRLQTSQLFLFFPCIVRFVVSTMPHRRHRNSHRSRAPQPERRKQWHKVERGSVSSSPSKGTPDCRAEATAGIDPAAERLKEANRRRRWAESPSKQQQATRRADFDSRAPRSMADLQDDHAEEVAADERLAYVQKRYDAVQQKIKSSRPASWSPKRSRRRSRGASSSTQATAGSKRLTPQPAADAMTPTPAVVVVPPEDYHAKARKLAEAREAHNREVLY